MKDLEIFTVNEVLDGKMQKSHQSVINSLQTVHHNKEYEYEKGFQSLEPLEQSRLRFACDTEKCNECKIPIVLIFSD